MPAPTDFQIQDWVYQEFGFWPKPAWIAHCKILCGLPVEDVRTYQESRFNLCPLDRQDAVIKALRHVKMVSEF